MKKLSMILCGALVVFAMSSCDEKTEFATPDMEGAQASEFALAMEKAQVAMNDVDYNALSELATKVAKSHPFFEEEEEEEEDGPDTFEINKFIAKIIFGLIPDDPDSDTTTHSFSINDNAIKTFSAYKVEWMKDNHDKDYKEFLMGKRSFYTDSVLFITADDDEKDTLVFKTTMYSEKEFSHNKFDKEGNFELAIYEKGEVNDILFAITCGSAFVKFPGDPTNVYCNGSITFDDRTYTLAVAANNREDEVTVSRKCFDKDYASNMNPIYTVKTTIAYEPKFFSDDVIKGEQEVNLLGNSIHMFAKSDDVKRMFDLVEETENANENGISKAACEELYEEWAKNCFTHVKFGEKNGKVKVDALEDESVKNGKYYPNFYVWFAEDDFNALDKFIDKNYFDKLEKND